MIREKLSEVFEKLGAFYYDLSQSLSADGSLMPEMGASMESPEELLARAEGFLAHIADDLSPADLRGHKVEIEYAKRLLGLPHERLPQQKELTQEELLQQKRISWRRYSNIGSTYWDAQSLLMPEVENRRIRRRLEKRGLLRRIKA